MNLLLCSMTVPWPTRLSQGAYHVSQAAALAEAGCRTTIFSPAPYIPRVFGYRGGHFRRHAERPAQFTIRGVQIHSPRAAFAYPKVARQAVATYCPRSLSTVASTALEPAVHNACVRAEADMILAHGLMPWGLACVKAARKCASGVCIIEHSAEDVMRLKPSTRLGEYYRKIAAQVRCVLVVGEPMRKHLADTLGVSNVKWIPNGVVAEDVSAGPAAGQGTEVLSAGHYYRRKGFEELVAAWPLVRARHRNARLTLVTDAPDSLARLISRSTASDSISLLPLQPAAKLRSLMQTALLFALPANGEAFGLVYAEALSVGTPVLMTSDCGLASLVSSPSEPLGWVLPTRTPRAIADAIIYSLDFPEDAHNRGVAGQRIVNQRFTWQANAVAVLGAFGRGAASA